jgi:hypothetical protein
MAPLSFSSLQQEDDNDIIVIFAPKIKKGGGEGSLPSSSHFCHHVK